MTPEEVLTVDSLPNITPRDLPWPLSTIVGDVIERGMRPVLAFHLDAHGGAQAALAACTDLDRLILATVPGRVTPPTYDVIGRVDGRRGPGAVMFGTRYSLTQEAQGQMSEDVRADLMRVLRDDVEREAASKGRTLDPSTWTTEATDILKTNERVIVVSALARNEPRTTTQEITA